MDTLRAIIAFSLAAGLLTVTPGLDTALVLRAAAVDGSRRGMQAAFGIALGCLIWGLAASVGLGALLAASRIAYDALRLAGALYLFWLGGRMLLSMFQPRVDASPQFRQARSWLWRGFLSNILNPKVGVFYITLLPLFVPPHVGVTEFSLLLTGIHVAEGLAWFWLLTSVMKPFVGLLHRSSVRRVLDAITGSVLIAIGGGLLFEKR